MDDQFFEPYIWDGDYDKQFYVVHLPDGTKVECWPNAGIMNSTDGSGRQWTPEDKPIVSVQRDEESRLYRPDKLREANERERAEYARRRGCVVVGGGAAALGQVLSHLRDGPITYIIDEAGAHGEVETAKIEEILAENKFAREGRAVSSIYASGVGTIVKRFDQFFKDEPRGLPERWRWVGGTGEGAGEKMIKERLRAKRARRKQRSKR